MTTTVDSLAADLQRFFAAKFSGGDSGRASQRAPASEERSERGADLVALGGDRPGSLLLIFDAAGRPVPANELAGTGATGVQDVLAHQWAAQRADELPAANLLASGLYLAVDGGRLSRWYSSVVSGSVPTATDETSVTAFVVAKRDAARALETNKLVVVSGTVPGGEAGTVQASGTHDSYYATSMSPVDWYEAGATCWQTYRFAASDSPAAVVAAPAPEGVRPPPAFQFRVADEVANPSLAEYARAGVRTAVVSDDVLVSPVRLGRVAAVLSSPVLSDASPVSSVRLSDSLDRSALFTRVVLDDTTPTPPTSDGFEVSFDYCLVRFGRVWWDDVFLGRTDWVLPGYPPGSVCSGSAASPAGPVTLMTVGMLVIRNLSISANWSADDRRAIESSVSLGPFCIAGSTLASGSGTISYDGMQTIAWLCQVPPSLPPA